MQQSLNRRSFLGQTVAGVAAVGLHVSAQEAASGPEHALAVISGKPRERGRRYGSQFKEAIRAFLEKEIFASFTDKPNTKEGILRYAQACGRAIEEYSPLIHEEMEGMAEGSGLRLEEVVLITNHEELWHRGLVPASDHCTVFGAAPPDTKDGDTFVCQTWDWMESVYGMSSMLHWKRPEGPSLLSYSYPGLWAGAGMNTSGLALCWHTGGGDGNEPRVGIPAYVLIAQALYQDTLKGALEEIRRAPQAGWFVYLLGDAQGRHTTVRGTPKKLEIVEDAKANGGRIVAEGNAKVDLARLQANCPKVKRSNTVDAMIFNCTKKEVHVTRRAGGVTPWKRFGF
ncbi:MAG TPA: C45 family peptidase [Planctomycetota bacterium]|nr:C45 family peptidase [Planctomycetota bacterium]